MDEKLKKNLLSESLWLRIFYMLIFYLAGQIAIMLVVILALVQGGFSLVTGSANVNLLVFSNGLNRFLYEVLCYLTFNSEKKPYPFSDWPVADQQTKDNNSLPRD